MSIFNKTDEERRIEEENRKWDYLMSEIRSSSIQDYQKRELYEYISGIRNGEFNDFETVDYLMNVILKLVKRFRQVGDVPEKLKELASYYHMIVNPQSENAPRVRERFLALLDNDDFYSTLVETKNIYTLFHNKEDYFEILDIIEEYCDTDDIEYVMDYAMKVSPYCLTQDHLKRAIISFLYEYYNNVDEDIDGFIAQEVENAKKRIGVYNVGVKEIASVDAKLRSIDTYFEQIDVYLNRLTDEKESILNAVRDGRKAIEREEKKVLSKLNRMIAEERKLFEEQLNSHLLEIEEQLRIKSDAVFNDIVETYQKQVKDFKKVFQNYTMGASHDLLEIKKETEESVKKLQEYVSSDPQLSELLSKAQEQSIVRDKIIKLVEKQEELSRVESKPEEKEVETIEIPEVKTSRLILPYSPIVLPSEIPKDINPFFDERIPFSQRKDEAFRRMKEREKQGEIFHKVVPQVLIDIMEGDWPYLYGPSGTGKDYMVEQIGSLLDMKVQESGKIVDIFSILGYNDPQGRYQITPTFIAALFGDILFLNEMDNGNADTQPVLNTLYSRLSKKIDNPEKYYDYTFGTDIRIDIHPNFRMISAGNTTGEGRNDAFSSRNKFDESIHERIRYIKVDYDDRVEEEILKSAPGWYKFCMDFRRACVDYASQIGAKEIKGSVSSRDAHDLNRYIKHDSKTIHHIMTEQFVQIKDTEYLDALCSAICRMYNFSEKDAGDDSYNGTLRDAKAKTLAKGFVAACHEVKR